MRSPDHFYKTKVTKLNTQTEPSHKFQAMYSKPKLNHDCNLKNIKGVPFHTCQVLQYLTILSSFMNYYEILDCIGGTIQSSLD